MTERYLILNQIVFTFFLQINKGLTVLRFIFLLHMCFFFSNDNTYLYMYNNNNNNNNNMLAYKAPVCQKKSEAPADRYSQC